MKPGVAREAALGDIEVLNCRLELILDHLRRHRVQTELVCTRLGLAIPGWSSMRNMTNTRIP